jgi:hypothetical protein
VSCGSLPAARHPQLRAAVLRLSCQAKSVPWTASRQLPAANGRWQTTAGMSDHARAVALTDWPAQMGPSWLRYATLRAGGSVAPTPRPRSAGSPSPSPGHAAQSCAPRVHAGRRGWRACVMANATSQTLHSTAHSRLGCPRGRCQMRHARTAAPICICMHAHVCVCVRMDV